MFSLVCRGEEEEVRLRVVEKKWGGLAYSEPLWTAVGKAETMDAESVAGVAGVVVIADFITFLAANSACNTALFSAFALLLGLGDGELGGSERIGRLCGSLGRSDGIMLLALCLGDHSGRWQRWQRVGGRWKRVRERDNRGRILQLVQNASDDGWMNDNKDGGRERTAMGWKGKGGLRRGKQ
jgi:hypothetical protein